MALNIHPIFTHFPVALFTLYSVFELLRFKKITDQPYWFYIKASFVIIGTLTSYLTYITGDMLEEEFTGPLVEMHSWFAIITLIIFTILSIAYLVSWIEKTTWGPMIGATPFRKVWNVLKQIRTFIMHPAVLIVLAFLGLIAITVTGALGGALAYGPDVDPAVSFIYHLLING